jgi:hypothetical protein
MKTIRAAKIPSSGFNPLISVFTYLTFFCFLMHGQLPAQDVDLVLRGSWPPFSHGLALAVTIQSGYAFVALDTGGLAIIDITSPANPQRVGGYDTSGEAKAVALSVNYAYVAGGPLQVIDVSNPTQPHLVGDNSAFSASDVTVAGDKVFATAGAQGLMIFDLFRAPLRLEPVSPQQPGAFRFLLHGEAGLSVRVQRSSNLRDWEDWQPVTLGTAPAALTDPDAGAVPHRFYRAVYP